MHYKRGIIGTIVLLIIALIVLGYYNISIKSIIENPTIQQNFSYAWDLVWWMATSAFWWIVNLIQNHSPNVSSIPVN